MTVTSGLQNYLGPTGLSGIHHTIFVLVFHLPLIQSLFTYAYHEGCDTLHIVDTIVALVVLKLLKSVHSHSCYQLFVWRHFP